MVLNLLKKCIAQIFIINENQNKQPMKLQHGLQEQQDHPDEILISARLIYDTERTSISSLFFLLLLVLSATYEIWGLYYDHPLSTNPAGDLNPGPCNSGSSNS